MTEIDSLVFDVRAGRKRFLELVAGIRPDLHRYCARMTGSVSDGEDIVQETLARAYYALPEIESLPPLRSWLFQIAHRRALDHLRRYDRRMGKSLEELADRADPGEVPDDAAAREEAVRAALSVFLELPPFPRSCVILKDVFGYSVDEIAALLEQSTAAVKAAVHRGRVRLRELRANGDPTIVTARPLKPVSPAVARYITLFNTRDWDGVRALLADEVRLDLVSRSQRSGRRDVSGYVANYARFDDWFLVPGWLDGAEVVAAFRSEHEAKPSYFIELGMRDGCVVSIRDFRYVAYICVDAAIEVAERPTAASFARTRSSRARCIVPERPIV
jgi:RNA polymerase sigma-70 factor (ECF subfamily)